MGPAAPATVSVGMWLRRYETRGSIRAAEPETYDPVDPAGTPPQHISTPVSVRAQVTMPFASIAIRRSRLGTGNGRLLLLTDRETPSCPYWFDPQQYAVPLAMPHVWSPPAEIEVNPMTPKTP